MKGPWREVGVDPYPKDKQRVLVCFYDDTDVWDMDNTRSNVATYRDYGTDNLKKWIFESEFVNGYIVVELEPQSVVYWAPMIEPPEGVIP